MQPIPALWIVFYADGAMRWWNDFLDDPGFVAVGNESGETTGSESRAGVAASPNTMTSYFRTRRVQQSSRKAALLMVP